MFTVLIGLKSFLQRKNNHRHEISSSEKYMEVSRVNSIPKYPYFSVIQFDKGVLAEIQENGSLIEYLYLDDCNLKYLPHYIFDFLPNLKWLNLR